MKVPPMREGGVATIRDLSGYVNCPVTGRVAPVRTCVGCRARAAKSDLLRVVAVEGASVVDVHGKLPGRGAHVHPDLACLDLAERRRAFPRALKVPGPLDLSALRQYVEARVQAKHDRRSVGTSNR